MLQRHQLKKAAGVVGGLWQYYTGKEISTEARRSLLELHCETNGVFTDSVAKIVRRVRPPRKTVPTKGILGYLSVYDQNNIADFIGKHGYYSFGAKIPPDLCDAITEYALQTPCRVEGRDREDRVLFNPDEPPISKTYRISEGECIANPSVQKLMADPSMLAIAETYLRTHPILSSTNLWWSAAFGDRPGDQAAQEFHFDFDPPPAWLLFFIYLTDVGPENGPHVYARGSHVAGIPATAEILSRGYVRIPDEDIEAAFGKERIVELHGKRGTVLGGRHARLSQRQDADDGTPANGAIDVLLPAL